MCLVGDLVTLRTIISSCIEVMLHALPNSKNMPYQTTLTIIYQKQSWGQSSESSIEDAGTRIGCLPRPEEIYLFIKLLQYLPIHSRIVTQLRHRKTNCLGECWVTKYPLYKQKYCKRKQRRPILTMWKPNLYVSTILELGVGKHVGFPGFPKLRG